MEYVDRLRVFRSVVELKSFARAADVHGITPPAVSRAISALEERIGCRLFERSTRKVALTEAAERFYDGCVRILANLEAIEAEVSDQSRGPEGKLRLVAHTTATLERLVPLIAGFKRSHPRVALDVTLTESQVDLISDGYDLGIVVPHMLTSETTIVRLLERVPVIMVAAPSYFRSSSIPTHPSELAGHLFIAMSPSMRRPVVSFRMDGEEMRIPMRFDVSSNSPNFNRAMVLEGFGIGIVPAALVRDDLASGDLVRLLTEFELLDDYVELQLAFNNRTLLPAKVRAFIDYADAFFDKPTRAGSPADAT